jgi:hypothetical protein
LSEVKSPVIGVNQIGHSFMAIWESGLEQLQDEWPTMTEKDISVPTGQFARDLSLAEFERALETLIVLAHSQGRNFLAYLLIMALMHLREDDQGRAGVTH